MAANKVSMKLLINSETNEVVFAEAGKDFVDFLFHIPSLPIATVIRPLKEHGIGCLSNLYASIKNLDEKYIQPDSNKDALLKPSVPSVPLLNPDGTPPQTENVFYKCDGYSCTNFDQDEDGVCGGCSFYYSDDRDAVCGCCGHHMTTKAKYVAPPSVLTKISGEGGFVMGGGVTYIISDDLVIKPMSPYSSTLTLFREIQVKVNDTGALKEKDVDIGMIEALKLLKASSYSKKVLTEVFLSSNQAN